MAVKEFSAFSEYRGTVPRPQDAFEWRPLLYDIHGAGDSPWKNPGSCKNGPTIFPPGPYWPARAPVTLASRAKNPRLRGELMAQLAGTLW